MKKKKNNHFEVYLHFCSFSVNISYLNSHEILVRTLGKKIHFGTYFISVFTKPFNIESKYYGLSIK